jgi:hypothetical protein
MTNQNSSPYCGIISCRDPYPVVEQARSSYMKISFFRNKEVVALQGCMVFSGRTNASTCEEVSKKPSFP